MSKKTASHLNFEKIMFPEIINFIWDEDLELYEDLTTQICWLTFLNTKIGLTLENDCMIDNTWFMKGTPVSNLIKYAEQSYKAEVISQNSKIEFGTDDHEHWFAHEVPFFGRVQIDKIEEHGLVEWDIYLDGCWQGPFNSKAKCIEHLEICIQEKNDEEALLKNKI